MLMRQAQEVQKKMQKLQEELANKEFEGSSAGGMVKATITGGGTMKKIFIDSSLVVKEEKEILEDLIVAAFNKMPDKKLIVIGDGPDLDKIKSMAGPNIELRGYLKFKDLIKYLQKAKAFVFAAIEDFGMLPVEAQACGTPVIAYNKGGSLETVVNNKTGVLFSEQTPESLVEAVKLFETNIENFNATEIRQHAEEFSVNRFKAEFEAFVNSKLDNVNI